MADEKFEKFRGKITWQKFPKITSDNEGITFRIVSVEPEDPGKLISVKGDIPDWSGEDLYEFIGKYEEDPKYGKSFALSQIVRLVPETNVGREKYLARWVEGIGAKTAKKLVKHFGSQIINILDNQPSRLVECPGITEDKADKIKLSWFSDHDPLLRKVGLWLAEHEIGDIWSKKFITKFGQKVIEVLTTNPYLSMQIEGIGFRKADELAKKLGWPERCAERTEAAVVFAVEESVSNGNCFLYRAELITEVRRIASSRRGVTKEEKQLSLELAEEAIIKAVSDGYLIKEDSKINGIPYTFYYLPYIHAAEKRLAERISDLQSFLHITPRGIEQVLERVEADLGYIPTELQKKSVREALTNNVSILTGGPGTGKTSIVQMVLRTAHKLGLTVALCAPTGRAAKRMSELTGEEAQTIHRLLEWSPGEEKFIRDIDDPLKIDLLIVDESSMLDINLADSLLQAIPDTCSVLFVGDINQLPSVGPGMVLKDLINSQKIPVTKLDQIFRQAENSMIIKNAHRIKNGESPVFPDAKKGNVLEEDSFFMEVPRVKGGPDSGKDNVQWIKEVLPAVITRIVEVQKIDPIHDIQVIMPMKKGPAGIYEFNKVLQKALNPNGREMLIRGQNFRIGDRVIQNVNNYTPGIELCNGDIGFIKSINGEEKVLIIDFYGQDIKYPFTEVDNLQLAYASTIHRGQGSEFPIVIMILTNHHYSMLQRNLLYTGATRAQKMLVFISSWSALKKSIESESTEKRNSFLAFRIRKLLTKRV